MQPKWRNIDPPNRFESVHSTPDFEHWESAEESPDTTIRPTTQFYEDQSKSLISENDSPDIPFTYSANPYRGCEHGCSYCYARNTHEYLGFNAGLDFDSKIVVKREAPRLFREFLSRKSYQCQSISFSGVTDCYQPAERHFRLTRQCFEVALECCQPVSIITKNALVLRDLDLLVPLASRNLVHVYLSINSLDADLARSMEPRTSTPLARLRAVKELANAKVPVGVMAAPIIPSLTDSEIPAVLAAAKEAGAMSAGMVLLRLPLTVEPVFREWLRQAQQEKQSRIEQRIRSTRDGQLNSSQWGDRMRGTGKTAEQIQQLFQVFAQKHGLNSRLTPLDTTQFTPPERSGQKRLF